MRLRITHPANTFAADNNNCLERYGMFDLFEE
jgi:hypothetical protein